MRGRRLQEARPEIEIEITGGLGLTYSIWVSGGVGAVVFEERSSKHESRSMNRLKRGDG